MEDSVSMSDVLLNVSKLQLIMVDELRNDYRNPVDFCQNLNRVSTTSLIDYMYNSGSLDS